MKSIDKELFDSIKESHPARGAWIEIRRRRPRQRGNGSHPARGAWIEMSNTNSGGWKGWSHPARGAWIEMSSLDLQRLGAGVAPRKGCVD